MADTYYIVKKTNGGNVTQLHQQDIEAEKALIMSELGMGSSDDVKFHQITIEHSEGNSTIVLNNVGQTSQKSSFRFQDDGVTYMDMGGDIDGNDKDMFFVYVHNADDPNLIRMSQTEAIFRSDKFTFSSNTTGLTDNWFVIDSTGGIDTVTIDGTLDVGAVRKGLINTTTTPYNIAAKDYTILMDATAGNKTVNLPAASSHTNRILVIKKIDSSANTVTIDGNASETIEGATTKVLTTQYESVMIQCDGSNWFIIGNI
jgi:hypothetical protein